MSAQLFMRSHYSLLNGLMSIDDILFSAKEKGFTSVALTDYRVMHGALDFFLKAPKHDIKPLIGLEIDIEDYRLVLIAKNNEGLKTLHRLSYKLSVHKTVEYADFIDNQADLIIIAPSEDGPFEAAIYQKNLSHINMKMLELKLKMDNFYIGITHQEAKFFQGMNVHLSNIAKRHDIESLALNKTFYKDVTDHHAFRALRAIDTQKLMSDTSLTFAPDRNFLDVKQLYELYEKEWIDKANSLANECNIDLLALKTDLPNYINSRDVPNETFLTNLSMAGIEKRLDGNVSKVYIDRLNYELDVINSMGFTNYFLIVYDVIRFAKQKGINVGPGRGSSAGSLIAYSLGITDVDPIEYKLMFERFLNPERATMPDIDIDFPDDRRDEVVEYAISKYGNDHVAHIVAFGTLRGRQSFRDCGRILNISIYKINNASKLINPNGLEDTYKKNKRFSVMINSDKQLKECFELALKIEGTPRHITQHAAGIVASSKKLLDVAPIVAIDPTINATQYDMTHLESIGLIKIDFLGLRNLSIIDRISKVIRQTEPDFQIHKIPLDDMKTFELIGKGETIGIFQLESSGMKSLLKKMNPSRFLDIVDTIALYRPGPMENIPQYLENRKNPQKIDYYHDDLKEITLDTFGILVYQEQIMAVAQKFAGFTLAKADILRRAMSSKDAEILQSLEVEFKEGAISKDYTEKLSTFIFKLIFKFANYGFNKSHSVAYGLVAYQLSYLKANYSEFFYTELLNSVIGDEHRTKMYIDECQRLGVKLEVPGLNTSAVVYEIHENLIRMPLTIIKGISKNISEVIVNDRIENGIYKSFVNAVVRLTSLKINLKQLEALIDAGTFDIFGLNRNTMRSNLDEVLLYANLITIQDTNNNTIFNYALVSEPQIEILDHLAKDSLKFEFEALGMYLSDYPTKSFRTKYKTTSLYHLVPQYAAYRVIVKIDRIREHLAKDGRTMAFLQISDETGSMDAVMFNNVYEHFRGKIELDDIALIKGQVKEEGSIIIKDFHIFET